MRNEYPIQESDTNVCVIKNLFEELCNERTIPDFEFFINRRDFPIITKNGTESYFHIFGKDKKLVSHSYEKYSPILGQVSNHSFADLAMPTTDDWTRVQNKDGKWFPKNIREFTINTETYKWEEKINTAIFRGSSTGYGTCINTNMRLKAAYLSQHTKPDENGIPYLDAGITKWNCRARKTIHSEYIQTIRVDELPFDTTLSPYMTLNEQLKYKYIINIDGHVKAFRLSMELGSGCVVLLVESEWKLWYSNMLIPYKHYVPVKSDLSDLIEQIKWCREK